MGQPLGPLVMLIASSEYLNTSPNKSVAVNRPGTQEDKLSTRSDGVGLSIRLSLPELAEDAGEVKSRTCVAHETVAVEGLVDSKIVIRIGQPVGQSHVADAQRK